MPTRADLTPPTLWQLTKRQHVARSQLSGLDSLFEHHKCLAEGHLGKITFPCLFGASPWAGNCNATILVYVSFSFSDATRHPEHFIGTNPLACTSRARKKNITSKLKPHFSLSSFSLFLFQSLPFHAGNSSNHFVPSMGKRYQGWKG